MSINKKFSLKHGETLIDVRRQTFLAYIFRYFFGIAVLFIDSFFVFWLMGQGLLGYSAIVFGFLLGLYIILRAFRRQRRNYWVVTDQRLIDIDRTSLFEEAIASIDLETIVDIFVTKKGLLSKLFNFGTLNIETGNAEFVIIIDKVRRPRRLADVLQDLCRARLSQMKQGDIELIVESFIGAIPELPLEHLEQIQDRINEEILNIEKEVESD